MNGMEETVKNFAIDWQDWAGREDMSYGELAEWTGVIKTMAELADESGELIKELKENGVL